MGFVTLASASRTLHSTCSSMARNAFSGTMLGRPLLMSVSYMRETADVGEALRRIQVILLTLHDHLVTMVQQVLGDELATATL